MTRRSATMTRKALTRRLLAALACCAFALVGCGHELDLDDGVGAKRAAVVGSTTSEAPEVVMLSIKSSASAKATTSCSAVALAQHWLLTAAHCIDMAGDFGGKRRVAYIRVTSRGSAGNSVVYGNSTSTGYWYSAFHIYPGWKGYVGSEDLALVQLYSGGMSSFTPALLYAGSERAPDYRNYRLIGWGHGDEDRTSLGVKRAAWTRAQGSWGNAIRAIGAQACKGDSGGALNFVSNGRHVLVGINSGGAFGQCGETYIPTVHAAITGRRISWMTHIAAPQRTPLVCGTFGYVSGWRYRQCRSYVAY